MNRRPNADQRLRRDTNVDWIAIWLSVRLAAATTLVLLAIGIPLAYWIVFSPKRWKFLVEAVVALPLVLPPTVLGFYVLVGIGPLSPVGRAYARVFGHGLPFTFEGLLIASVLYSLPFAVQPFAAEFASVDRRVAARHVSPGGDAALHSRSCHRHRPELRAHAG